MLANITMAAWLSDRGGRLFELPVLTTAANAVMCLVGVTLIACHQW